MDNNLLQIIRCNTFARIITSGSKKNVHRLLAASAIASSACVADAQTALKADVNTKDYCAISEDEFAQWFPRRFKSRKLSRNSIVTSPDNLSFEGGVGLDADFCKFYKRAEQMFLWLTSPYGQGSYVFSSPIFYDVWSAERGRRTLKVAGGTTRNLSAKIDIELDQAAPGEAAPGEADATVLMTQGCKLVYYLIQVNDVYAYFLTGTKNGEITPIPTSFPTTADDLRKIQDFGQYHSKTFPDAKTLAVELKTAWIETTGFSQSEVGKYITMRGRIPTYKPMSCSPPSTTWIRDGFKDTLLALVGMHVVFSAREHPEMLWTTFENVNNTPNAEYQYFSTKSHSAQPVPQDTGLTWLFAASNAAKPFNVVRMRLDLNGNIRTVCQDKFIGPSNIGTGCQDKFIEPSNILRNAPWGTSSPGDTPNNTKIISVNKQVIDRLADGDVRKNYIMIGTTWTADGKAPTPPNYAGPSNHVGAKNLVNTTMETFFHEGSSNCLDCHHGPNMLGDACKKSGLSHVFGVLPPLSGSNRRKRQCNSVN
jgi:hypothetical protein